VGGSGEEEGLKLEKAALPVTVILRERMGVIEAPMEKEGVVEGDFSVGVEAMEGVKDTEGVGVRSVGVGSTERDGKKEGVR
jgi:hypothetical protein